MQRTRRILAPVLVKTRWKGGGCTVHEENVIGSASEAKGQVEVEFLPLHFQSR